MCRSASGKEPGGADDHPGGQAVGADMRESLVVVG
jgi:hypothetical protein